MHARKNTDWQHKHSGSQRKMHPGAHMSFKAGEMRTMTCFAQAMLLKYGGVDRYGPHLLAAGSSLNEFIRAIGDGGPMPTPEQMTLIRTSYDTHLRCCKACGISLSPKHHLTCHLVDRTSGSVRN
jgi:hypothetical protein